MKNMNLTTVAPTDISYNPLSYRRPFTFTDRDEWIDALCQEIQQRFDNVESACNFRRLVHADFDLSKAEWYRWIASAEEGTNEGHYVYLRADHRKTGVLQTLISAKTFGGLDYAIDIAGFITRALYTP